MYLWWIFPLFLAPAYQISDPNCLRDNKGAIDAEFTFSNRYENHSDVNGEDFAKHISLFSRRFRRAHRFSRFSAASMQYLENGMSLFTNASKPKFELFLSASNLAEEKNLTRAVLEHKEEYDSIMKINSGNDGPIVGLYLKGLMDTWKGEHEAVLAAFGPKNSSTFPVGHFFENCTRMVMVKNALDYLQRLNFITCNLPVVNKPTPEESADDVLSTCDVIRDFAFAAGITADMRCRVGYPSYGKSSNGIVGSVVNFQKFWCRIVGEITRVPGHAKIIMMTAFDDNPNNYKAVGINLNDGKFYGGWWRRRVTTSYGTNAFVEKVEELEGNTEPRNCTEECNFCHSNEQCCEGRICIIDSSFQPFENERQAHVCQSSSTTCAPRFPVSSAIRWSTQSNLSSKVTSSADAHSGGTTQQPMARTSVHPTFGLTNHLPNNTSKALLSNLHNFRTTEGPTPSESGKASVMTVHNVLISTLSTAMFHNFVLCT